MIQFYNPEVWDTKQNENKDIQPIARLDTADAFDLRRDINSIAMSEATVRDELYRKFAMREAIMKSQGITPAGDYRNPDELEALDEQIAEINSNRSGDLLEQNNQVFTSVRDNYLRLSKQYESLPAMERFLVSPAADIYDYFTLDHEIDQFRAITNSAIGATILKGINTAVGVTTGITSFGGSMAAGYVTNVIGDIQMGKREARLALGLEVEEERATLDTELNLLIMAHSLYSGRGIPSFKYLFDKYNPMRSEDPATRTIAIYNNIGKNRPGKGVVITKDTQRDLNQYNNGEKIIRDSINKDTVSYKSIRDFINEESAGALEYFGGTRAGETTARDSTSLENFRVLLEGGGSVAARRKQFTRTFGEDGRILQWALDPKAPLDNEIKSWIRTNLGDRFRLTKRLHPSEEAELNRLKDKYLSLKPPRNLRANVKEAYKLGKERSSEIKEQMQDLRAERKTYEEGLRDRYRQIRSTILSQHNINPSAKSKIPTSIQAEINAAQKADKEFRTMRIKELDDNIVKLRDSDPMSSYRKLRDTYQKKNNEYAKARTAYEKYRDSYSEDSIDIIKQEKAKHATQIMFAKYLNELNIENRIDHLYKSSTTKKNLYNNALSYLDQIYYQSDVIANDFMPIAETMLEKLKGRYKSLVIDDATTYEFLKILYGGKSTNTYAASMADALTAVTERATVEYNKKGVDFQQLNGFVPNIWNKPVIAVSDRKKFVEDLLPHVDFDRTYAAAGIGPGLDRTKFLSKAYKSLVAADREPFYRSKRDTMEKRVLSRRVIFFKSPDAYLAVMNKYGKRLDPLEMIRNQIFSHADNLAKISMLGNTPSNTIDYMSDLAIDLTANKFGDRSVATKNRIFNLHKEIYNDRFESYQFISEPGRAMQVADLFLSATRVSYLGYAGLSAFFGDIAPTVGYLSTVKSGVLHNTLEYMHKRLTSAGLSAKEAKLVGIATEVAYRDFDSINKSRVRFYGARQVDVVENLNFANYITRYNKIIVNQILMEELGSHSKKRFNQLPSALHDALKESGMTHVSWDAIRLHTVSIRGMELLSPRAIKPVDSKMQRGVESLQLFLSIMELDSIASYRPSSNVTVPINLQKAAAKARSENKVLKYMLASGFAMFNNITQSSARSINKLWHSARSNYKLITGVAIIALTAAVIQQWTREIGRGQIPTNIAKADANSAYFVADSIVRTGAMGVATEMSYNMVRQLLSGRRPDVSIGNAPLQSAVDLADRLVEYIKTDDEKKQQAIINDTVRKLALEGVVPLRTLYGRIVVDNFIRAIDPDADMYFDQVLDKKLKQGKSYYWAPGRSLGEQVRPDNDS